VGLALNFRFALNSFVLRRRPRMPFHDMFANGPLMEDPTVERVGVHGNLSAAQFAVTHPNRRERR
jgi:hypothetical protein